VRLQVAFNLPPAVGDLGFVNQWVVGSTKTNYFPVTRSVSAGVSIQQFWDTSLSPNNAGYGCDNPYIIDFVTFTDVVLVTNVSGVYSVTGWSGNYGSFASSPVANAVVINTIAGDVLITELGPAQTLAMAKRAKEREKKEQGELKEKVAELSAALAGLVSANGLKPLSLAKESDDVRVLRKLRMLGDIEDMQKSDKKEIEMVCPKEPRLPTRFEDMKMTEWENAKAFALRKFGDAKSVETGKVSPTPSLAVALDRVKEDYVVLSKDEKSEDGSKRSRSLPRKVQ